MWIASTDEEGRCIVVECKCRKAKIAKELLRKSGLADFVDQQRFDTFVTDTPIQQRMKETAEHYKDTLLELNGKTDVKRPWLYIGGNPGSGKTHICTAVCGELLKNNIGVRYMQWLVDARNLKLYSGDEYDEAVDEYVRPSVLYIDDLLKQKYTENPVFTEADIKIAFTILNARYFQNKPTIISSEWDLLDHLMAADEGVFSRVYERCKGFTVYVDRRTENNYRFGRGTEICT